MEPCQQAVPIAKLEVTTEQISRTLERLGTVLEKIAEQATRVDAVEDNVDTLFERVRTMEIDAAKDRTKIGFIVSGIATVVSVATGYIGQLFSE